MNVDKIPIELIQYSPTEEGYKLGTLEITKGEYAMAEKYNELVDVLRDHEERLFRIEKK